MKRTKRSEAKRSEAKRSEAKRTSLVTEVCEATNPLLTRRTFFARRSGAGRILADGGEGLAPADPNARAGAGPGANQIYSHLLPHGTKEEAERGARGARTSHKVDFGATGEIRYNNYGLNYVNEYGIDSDDEDDGGGCCWPSVCCSGWNEETAAPTR